MDATLAGRCPCARPPAPSHPRKAEVRYRGQDGNRSFIRVTTARARVGLRDGTEAWGAGSVAAHAPPTGWAGGPSGWRISDWLVYNRVDPVSEECHAGEEVGATAAGPPGPGGHAMRQAVADEGGAPVPLQGGRRVRASQAQPPYSAPTQNHCSRHPQILSPPLALGTRRPAACTLFPQLCWVNSYLQLRSHMPPGTPCCPGLGLSRARPCLDT